MSNGPRFLSDERIADIRAQYDAPGRHYHDTTHLDALLGEFDRHQNILKDPEAVRLAIYYHDIIYKPLRSDNEEQSARLLEQEAEGLIEPRQLSRAAAMIRATAGHQLPNSDDPALARDAPYFLDMDLGILGAPPERYNEYESQIAKEYKKIPRFLYRRGRKKVLKSFLERERLYFTDDYHDRLETRARENLTRAIANL